jgi:hypothetical protein
MQALKNELKKLISLFRGLLSDNPSLYNRIDEYYESALLKEVSWIPDFICESIINGMKYIYALIESINLNKLSGLLSTLPDGELNLDIKEMLISAIKQVKEIPKNNKPQIINLIVKLSPILDCASEITKHPPIYLNRYTERDSNNFLN